MSLRVEPLPGEPKTVAFFYGPVALAGELGTQGIEKINLYIKSQLDLAKVPSPDVPVLLCEPGDLLKHIEPVADKPLTFRTKGIGRPNDVTLSPYYRLHHQRYSVYWQCFTGAEWQAKQVEIEKANAARKVFEARIVDEVRPGEQQPETDHNFKGERTSSGLRRDRAWRDARGGWFSYDMKVVPDLPVVLRCTYWGGDKGREFDVLVDGEKIAAPKWEPADDFITEEYPIPALLTRGKERVAVKFQAAPNSTAGGVFEVQVLKANP